MDLSVVSIALFMAGAFLGGLVVWGVARGRREAAYERGYGEAAAETERLRERAEQLDRRAQEARQERDRALQQLQSVREAKTRLESEIQAARQKLTEHKDEVEALQASFADRFENLANEILDKKSRKFTEQNEEHLGQLLKPLQEKIQAFEKTVEATHKEDLKERAQLKERIQGLADLNKQMSAQAQDLVHALEGQSKTQGDWGEMILGRLLEESGLTEGREYVTQESITTENGSRVRPDVVVRLPEDRYVVIDAKVSIVDYRRHVSAETEAERQASLKRHLASVRSHVNDLSGKQYDQLHRDRSPDFVLLFVPVEPAFASVLKEDEGLYNEAFRKNVVIVSPTTLLATLSTIASIWKQEYQAQNAREIAERGGRLYDKFCLLAEALEEVGTRLEQTHDSYRTVMNRLTDGQGNLVRQVEMLRELGADASKQLPAGLQPRPGVEE
jgi:DNA recombination protein RmuC